MAIRCPLPSGQEIVVQKIYVIPGPQVAIAAHELYLVRVTAQDVP